MRAGAEDVVSGIGGQTGFAGLGLAAEICPQAEPCIIFLTSGRDVAREKAEHRPHDDAEGQRVACDGNDGAHRLYVAQIIQNTADEKQDHLDCEQRVKKVVCTVSTV